jgi:cysteine desulfurase
MTLTTLTTTRSSSSNLMTRRIISLDANASVPPVHGARAALLAALDVCDGVNPSSPHILGRRARRLLDEARDATAAMLGASPKDVFFTSGATEGNRFAVDLLVEAARHANRPWRVVTTTLEHPSLYKPLRRAAERGLLELAVLPIVDGAVVVAADAIADLLQGADAVVVTAAHNETGLIIDTDALARAIDVYAPGAVFAVDAAQYLGRRGAPTARADIVVASAHKLGGIAGAGALTLRGRARSLALPWVAGGQEQGVRPGTEATPAIAAMAAAANVIDDTRTAHRALAPLRDLLERAVVDAGAIALVAAHDRLENTSAFLVPGSDPEALRMTLDQAGVAVGFGAACSALAPEASPSLMALGLSAHDTRRVVRVSLSPQTSSDDIDEAIVRIVNVIDALKAP